MPASRTAGLPVLPERSNRPAETTVARMTQGRLGARETVLALAIGVFIAHASLLANWVVDDAGITFAYARNLARGHGLVSQPGLPPVEGFSNPLWTLVIAALYAMGLFTPVVSKVVGGVLVVATLVLVWADLRRRGASALGMAVPLLLIAACTPFVVWTTSGLENALLAFLVVVGALLAIRAAEAPSLPVRTDVAAGLMAGLTAMTRPDAVVYAALYPATVLLARVRAEGLRAILRRWLAFGAASAGVYGGYLAFRLGYYRQWFPNTFYAKQKPSLTMATRRKLIDLLEGASGDLWPLVVVLLGIVVGWLLVTGRLRARTAVLMGYLGVSGAVFLVLPFDWMGELRFATVCFPLFFWVLSASAQDATAAGSSVVQRRAVLAGTALFVAQAILIFAARTLAFASDPTLPLDDVEAYGGDGFNRLAEVAGVADASLLTPDIGGALLDSRLRIFDLGGLCDERIARSMSSGH